MPTVKVPLFSEVMSNVKGIVLNDKSYRRVNGYADELGGINVRPGETGGDLVSNTNERVDGIYSWPDRYLVSVTGNRVSYRTGSLYSNDLTLVTVGGIYLGFAAGTNVIMCNDATYIYFAGGAKIYYADSVGTLSVITDADAPTIVTHIAFLDGYILANSTDNKFYWSDLLAGTAWTATALAQAVGNPDKIVALYVFNRQIHLFGTATLEIWENDGESPFSRIPGGFYEIGCIAPYSVAKLDNSVMWLSDKRYFIELKGGVPKRRNTPFDSIIYNMTDISDCITSRLDVDGRSWHMFKFTKGNKSFVFDPITEQWEEWGIWDSQISDWKPLEYTFSAQDKTNQKTYVGTESVGFIVTLSPTVRTSVYNANYQAGVEDFHIRFYSITGWLDFGTSKRKRANNLRFRAKRGEGTEYSGDTQQPEPKLIIRWRDDGSDEWTGYYEAGLGYQGDNEMVINLGRTGIFKTRQYELSCTDQVTVCFADAEDDIEVLAS